MHQDYEIYEAITRATDQCVSETKGIKHAVTDIDMSISAAKLLINDCPETNFEEVRTLVFCCAIASMGALRCHGLPSEFELSRLTQRWHREK